MLVLLLDWKETYLHGLLKINSMDIGNIIYFLLGLTSGSCICFGLLFLCLVYHAVKKKPTEQEESPTPIKETL